MGGRSDEVGGVQQDLSHRLVTQHSHLGLGIGGLLYENTAGYREPTAACNLIPSLIGRNCYEIERDLVALPVCMGGVGLINPSVSADAEYQASIRVSAPLVSKIEAQSHETPEGSEVQRLVYATRKEKDDELKEELEEVKAMLPDKTQRAVDLACM